jgi:hypothetical protein
VCGVCLQKASAVTTKEAKDSDDSKDAKAAENKPKSKRELALEAAAAHAKAEAEAAAKKAAEDGADASTGGVRTLEQILAAQPNKRESILNHIEATINKAVSKELVMFRYVHTLTRYSASAFLPPFSSPRCALCAVR